MGWIPEVLAKRKCSGSHFHDRSKVKIELVLGERSGRRRKKGCKSVKRKQLMGLMTVNVAAAR